MYRVSRVLCLPRGKEFRQNELSLSICRSFRSAFEAYEEKGFLSDLGGVYER